MTVLPFGLLVFLMWAMTCGSTRSLPLAACVTTFLVQTHVGYVSLAVPLLAFGAAWLACAAASLRRRTSSAPDPTVSALTRATALTGLLLALLWLLPMIEQLTNEPGNLTNVLDYFRNTQEPLHTLGDGINVLSAQFSIPPAWFTGDRPITVAGEPEGLADPSVPVLVIAAIAAAVVIAKRGIRSAKRFALTLGIVHAVGVISIARPGPLYMYRLDWNPIVGMMTALMIVWATWTAIPHHRRVGLREAGTATAFGITIMFLGINTAGAINAESPQPALSEIVDELAPQILTDVPPGDGQVIFRRGPDVIAGSVGRGLELSLEHARVRTVAGGEEDPQGPIRAQYTIVTDQFALDLISDPAYELIAHSGTTSLEDLEPGEHLVAILRPPTD